MSSFEFQYVRLTAQSSGWDAKVQGDKPEFPPAFIAQMVGRIQPYTVYQAAFALYCDDLMSMDDLNLGMANWGWKHIQTCHPCRSYKALEVSRVAELAVLMYLYPWIEENRSEAKCAAWVHISRQTWKAKYSHLRDEIVYKLHNMKSSADIQFREIMREDRLKIA